MLNQTNIGHNNNKFYVAQVLVEAEGGEYFTWNRWGRVVRKHNFLFLSTIYLVTYPSRSY